MAMPTISQAQALAIAAGALVGLVVYYRNDKARQTELARRTGSNLETVRYYEKVGLLPEPPRTAAGYRSYDIAHERRRELGFSLEEIGGLLRLVDERDQPCAEARDVAAVHLADIRAKIADPG